VPAPLSSPVDPALGHLVQLAADAAEDWNWWPGWLIRAFGRGVRHCLAGDAAVAGPGRVINILLSAESNIDSGFMLLACLALV
jgi:hypothetical protein